MDTRKLIKKGNVWHAIETEEVKKEVTQKKENNVCVRQSGKKTTRRKKSVQPDKQTDTE